MVLLSVPKAHAQATLVETAYKFATEGKLDSAKLMIDNAVQLTEFKNASEAWMVRGFIYKECYKTKEGNNVNSPLREEGVKSLLVAKELDSDNKHSSKINSFLKFFASKYHNDLRKTLDTLNYPTSISNFNKFLNIEFALNENYKPQQSQLEFYLALQLVFQSAFEMKKEEYKFVVGLPAVREKYCKHFSTSEDYLKKALAIDSTSKSANKNYALLWYNRGVNLIMNCPPDIGLDTFIIVQEYAVLYFKNALSYALRAHRFDPTDPTVVEMLQGIYWQINDRETFKLYEKLGKLLREKRLNGTLPKTQNMTVQEKAALLKALHAEAGP